MSLAEIQGAAAYSMLEILIPKLIEKGIVSKAELQADVKRYADLHAKGERLPKSWEVAQQMLFLVGLMAEGREVAKTR